MRVTNVRVSFLREKQPAQFEKSRPEVEFAATLEDGDDHVSAARQLMTEAATIVYAGIGYDVPAKVAAALAGGNVPAEVSVVVKGTGAAPEPSEAPAEATPAEPDKPKTRGRPVGSKNTAPKKETAKAKRERLAAETKAADELAAGAVGDDDAVPGDEPTPNISTGGERVDLNDADDIPGDDRDERVEEEFTPKMLHDLMTDLIRGTPRKLSIINAKQVLAKFKVARAGDLTPEQALEGKAMVEEMVKAFDVQQGA